MNTKSINWITPDELYKIFGIAKQTQAQYRVAKTIPFSQVGKKIFYKKSDIDKWIDDAKVV